MTKYLMYLLLGMLLFPCYSIEVFDTIGLAQTIFIDEEENRSLQTHIWYPTDSQETKELGGNAAFKGFSAVENGEISLTKKAPLYILLHGTSGNWKNLSWLAADLAHSGAIVVAANHPGSMTGDASPASVIKMWNQPQDISFLIDRLLVSEYNSYIDEDKIIVIGVSLGGYSALAVSGAQLEFERFSEFSAANDDESSRYFKPILESLDENFYTQANQDYRDERVDAAVALAPGFAESMAPHSIETLEVPVLIIGAENDENVPPRTHLHWIADYLPAHSRYHEITESSHYSFLQECKPGALELLAEEGAEFVCQDGGNKSRAEIHDEIVDCIDKFFETL